MKLRVAWLVGALFLISCGGQTPHLHVPGNPDEVDEVYEAVVALVQEVDGNIVGPYCTATYISPRLLATAAHCTSPGHRVSFLEYHHYNEWIERGQGLVENRPVVTHAMTVGIDDENDHDVALLELEIEESDSEHWLEMRNLEEEPIQVGSHAYSIGMPVGQVWILTEGIISRVHIRSNNSVGILHQVRIGPGSSGSGLLDDNGRMIGINSSGWAAFGVGIILGEAKPISYIQTLIKTLKAQREIERLDREFEETRESNA